MRSAVLHLLVLLAACGVRSVEPAPAPPPAPPPASACGLAHGRAGLGAPQFAAGEEWTCAEACTRGDAGSCVALGIMYEEGQNLPRDYVRAFATYAPSCDGGYLPACSHLAWLLWRGLGALPDVARASALARQSCDHGESHGCTVLGEILLADGLQARAVTSFELACDLGDGPGCTALGRVLVERAIELGARGLSDEAELRLLQAAARAAGPGAHGVAGSVGNAATAQPLSQGATGPANATLELAERTLERARAAAGAACDAGHAPACLVVAQTELERAPERARDLYVTACRGGVVAGCVRAADVLTSGRLGVPDDAQAIELLDTACSPAGLAACRALATLGPAARARLAERCNERRAVACHALAGDAPSVAPGAPATPATVPPRDAPEPARPGALPDSLALGREELLARACELGLATSCGALGTSYLTGTAGVARDPARARQLFEEACQAEDAAACRQLGLLLEGVPPVAGPAGAAPGAERTRDLDAARDLFARACVQGDLEGCVDLARTLRARPPAQPELAPRPAPATGPALGAVAAGAGQALAELLDDRACAAGVLRACAALGERRLRSPEPATRAAAAELLQQTCQAPDATGAVAACPTPCTADRAKACSLLAWATAEGIGAAPNLVVAASLSERGCDAGDMLGCAVLGYLYVTGRGVPLDEKRGLRLFEASCTSGIGIGCANLAVCHLEGIGTRADAAAAFAWNERACALGVQKGCAELAWHYLHGVGVKTDEAAGHALMLRACDGGYGPSCTELGRAHEAGRAPEASPERAQALYTQACTAGEVEGCYRRAQALDAPGPTRDVGAAAHLYGVACDGGQPQACNRLGELHEAGDGVARAPLVAVERYEQALRGGEERAIDKLLRLQRDGLVAPRRFEADLGLACEHDHAPSCRTLANLYWEGRLVARDEARAGRFAERACAAHDAAGCTALGRMQLVGTSAVRRDRRAAIATLERACPDVRAFHRTNEVLAGSAEIERDLRGCLALGQAVRPGDPARARALYDAACAEGLGAACYEAAALPDAAPGPPRPGPTASRDELLLRACELGEGRACVVLGDRARRTAPARAAALFARACREDHAEACRALGELVRASPAAVPAEARTSLAQACARGVPEACGHDGPRMP
ncbi:MAG: sel1 repeat family protein [Polyangiaceae bacterium]|nr:sel1 repeat family protein [Polyangiaceae bacterium]